MYTLEQKAGRVICKDHGRRMKYINLNQCNQKVRCAYCSPIGDSFIDFEMVEDLLQIMRKQQQQNVSEIIEAKSREFNSLLQQIYKLLEQLTFQAENQLNHIKGEFFQDEFFELYLQENKELKFEDLQGLSEMMTQHTIVERQSYKVKEFKVDQQQLSKFDEFSEILKKLILLFPRTLVEEVQKTLSNSSSNNQQIQ